MRRNGNYASNHNLTIGGEEEEEYSNILYHFVLCQTLPSRLTVKSVILFVYDFLFEIAAQKYYDDIEGRVPKLAVTR